MQQALKEIIEEYEKTVTRKENLVRPFHKRKSKDEEPLDISEHTRMLILEAEIQQLKEIIADLRNILPWR
jgi:predicted  nucleic acid-binding Zn-ribbon protein